MLGNSSSNSCTHESFWNSHPPVPIQVQNGALLVTVMYCENCGYIEYRSPPLSAEDEAALNNRVEEFNRKQNLLTPLTSRKEHRQ